MIIYIMYILNCATEPFKLKLKPKITAKDMFKSGNRLFNKRMFIAIVVILLALSY